MPVSLPIIGGILQAGAGISSMMEGKAAKEEAKVRGEKLADIELEMSKEEYRRTEELGEKTVSEAHAIGGATGLGGKSRDVYISKIESDIEKELAWITKSGKYKAEQARMTGQAASRQASAVVAGGAGQLGSSLATLGKAW